MNIQFKNLEDGKPFIVRVVSKKQVPWNMEGRSGISYQVTIRSEDTDVEKVKVTKEVFDSVSVDKDFAFIGNISLINGRANFSLGLPDKPENQNK